MSDDDWKPINEAPEVPGTYIKVRATETYRWLAYKPIAVAKMKKAGRWQRWNGYGWDNSHLPEGSDFAVVEAS